jgi:hypothetical protein
MAKGAWRVGSVVYWQLLVTAQSAGSGGSITQVRQYSPSAGWTNAGKGRGSEWQAGARGRLFCGHCGS